MAEADLILAVLILVAATLYSSVGHAGASGYLAAMALFGLAPEAMRPAALSLNILVASIATIRYARAGQSNWQLLWPFAVTSVPAAFIAGAISVPPDIYKPLVGAVLAVSAVQFIRTAGQAPLSDRLTKAPHLATALAAGAGLGLLAGLTGTGGGIFLSPLILFMGWADTRSTSGVVAAFILVNSISGLLGTTVSIGALPNALPFWAIAAAVGGLIGTQLGTRHLQIPGLRYALAAVLFIAAAKLILA
ncbi:MAG: sulfite exporter TauE/SafE family protein [Alphaproteobacteria bacterium]|nr:sulfite exporter TauE/SafE family protein [Alphaproteobacteria bacterium]